jgi:hypothetical protein
MVCSHQTDRSPNNPTTVGELYVYDSHLTESLSTTHRQVLLTTSR